MSVYGFLRSPRWAGLAIVTGVLTFAFVSLGLWQLERLDQVREDNDVISARLATEAESLEEVVDRGDPPSAAGAAHAFRRVIAVGVFDPAEEVLIRSQTHNGVAGFHVVTPLLLDESSAILVNRGWVPLEFDTPPVPSAPDAGVVTVELILQATQERSRFGPADPDGDAARLNRIDIARIRAQTPFDLYPVYGLVVESTGGLPVPVELPDLSDGPHLPYAIQWFAFAGIAIVGFATLAYRTAHVRKDPRPRRTSAPT